MPGKGHIRAGGLTERLLAAIEIAERPVQRHLLLSPLSPRERINFGRSIDRLVTCGRIRETRAGFISTAIPPVEPTLKDEPEARRLSPGQRAIVCAVIDRAHRYRRSGSPFCAANLLQRASERKLPPHVQQDLAALASLFGAHRQTFPEVDLGRAAA
ncbi:hypothetical protein FQV39_28640 [Bosea sp. F3-2]|uniref:hypothetical protein n=1 Tax=Bosea sp. F3-2 TaxID=2599640 RepID=UPI0011EBD050|nr:hypothetical protein [Bosea sp. F3-2]QEL26133.1 hypothetical protein FQV39_28640 [Bosea sp. F3-2]